MPEINSSSNLTMGAKILELKKRLAVEQKMYEASKLIQAKLDKQSNVQHVENSLKETRDRIEFLKEQISETENKLYRSSSASTEYLDALEGLSISSKTTDIPNSSVKYTPKLRNLDLYLAGKRISGEKINHKICDLSCRLKISENILEAETKIIEAFRVEKDGSENGDLRERREFTKQRVQILGQALKKYTSLKCDGTSTNPATPFDDSSSILDGPSNQFTGKLQIKITKIGGIIGRGAGSPFKINVNVDQWAGRNAASKAPAASKSVLLSCSKDPQDSASFVCYQEISTSLLKASELEISVCSGTSGALQGLIFVKLLDLFPAGPDEKASLVESFEIEPSGAIGLQFHYTPDKVKKEQMGIEKASRIERRPAIIRTQHIVKGHELISTNLFQLFKCSYCQELIMNTSGYECKLCKLKCHKKCYNKLFNTCVYGDEANFDKIVDKKEDPLIEQFISKYKIPHHQKLVNMALPNWCSHCGHMLPLGRKVNYKCEECSLVWHDRCDAYICKDHCGLNANLLENYVSTIHSVHRDQQSKSASNIKTSCLTKSISPPKSEQSFSSVFANAKNLCIDDFELIRCIGKGNFGKVMLVKYTATQDSHAHYYAIKILKKHCIVENEEYDSLMTEKRVFQLATQENHPFLVQLQAVFQDEFRVYFVMEFVNGGDLMYHIQSRPFSLTDCKFYAAQVLLALEYLHGKGILYRDLKLDNILLTSGGNVKLADYGLSKCEMSGFEAKTKTFCGTPEFMAPELLMDVPYGLAVDYWAFGVLLYQMLENKSPFYGNNEKEIFQSIIRGRPTFSPETDKDGKALISKLLQTKPSERLGVKNSDGWRAIKKHAFFSEINWNSLASLKCSVPFVPKIENSEDFSNFDEVFTEEDVQLTPSPSFVYADAGNSVAKAMAVFAEF